MFYGYCFFDRGDGNQTHTEAVNLNSPQEVWNYINLQKRIFPEVRITDNEDFCCVQTIDGKITFPPEWVEMEKLNNS